MKTLADRLAYAMKIKGMTQGGLSKASGLSQPTIWRLVQGKASGSTRINDIARALSVNADWLSSGIGDMEGKQGYKIEHPVFSDSHAQAVKIPIHFPSGLTTGDFIFVPEKIYTDGCIAYTLDRNTGINEITKGTIVIVDSKEIPGNGDLVYNDKNSQLVFRFVSGGSNGFLSVDDPRVPLTPCSPGEIFGVIVFIFKSFRDK